MMIRGSGIVAFLLLSGATIWGLLLSTKVLGRAVKAKPVTWFHESLGLGAVLATMLHMVALGADNYISFGWRELLLPGASSWEPLAVAFGVSAFYAMVIVSFSFYFKRFIKQSTWRAIHFLSFGTFAAALIHGVYAGTDSGEPAVFGMYVVAGTTVLILVGIRLVQSATPERPAPRTRTPRRAAVVSPDAPATVDASVARSATPVAGSDLSSAGDRSAQVVARDRSVQPGLE